MQMTDDRNSSWGPLLCRWMLLVTRMISTSLLDCSLLSITPEEPCYRPPQSDQKALSFGQSRKRSGTHSNTKHLVAETEVILANYISVYH